MYLFVRVQEQADYYSAGPEGRVKARIEEASGERCLIVPYQEFDLRVVKELAPRAMVMSGFGRHFQDREVKSFFGMSDVLHQVDLPMLCICGSHQLLGFAFESDLRKVRLLKDQPMRRLKPDEDLPRRAGVDPEYDLSSYFVADGFYPIRQVAKDPLFQGLPARMMMRCNHYCEVKRLPPNFKLLATSGHCRIEAMRHRERPLYGVQFHPEAFDAPFFHGRQLLRNFARLVDGFSGGGPLKTPKSIPAGGGLHR
jgi:GMP synthase-like glutamine amidotransferase